MRPGAVLPIKHPLRVKSRLSGLWTPERRAGWARAALARAVRALRGGGIRRIVAVCQGDQAMDLARAHRLEVVVDPDRGLGPAVDRGLELLHTPVALVLLPDLPEVEPADVVAAREGLAGVQALWAPDRRGQGLNLLGCRPGSALLPTPFGRPDSRARIRKMARERGLSSMEIHRPGLARDLDLPMDVSESMEADRVE